MKKAILMFSSIAIAIACSSKPAQSPTPSEPFANQKSFSTPTEAAHALVDAAAGYDVKALLAILGPSAKDQIASADPVQDRSRAAAFVAKAREKMSVQVDPKEP